MADCRKKIEAELEQISTSLSKLPDCSLSELNELELSGVGGILQSFYNGIENILKQVFIANDRSIPNGVQWHQNLLQQAVKDDFISQKTMDSLIPYLTFRHLYRNAYVLDLRAERMQSLVDEVENTLSEFKRNTLKSV